MIGVIGFGNMASAIIEGTLKSGLFKPEEIIASTKSFDKLKEANNQLGIQIALENQEVARKANILMLGVKPHLVEKIIKEIRDDVSDDTVIVSIAAGITINKMSRAFGREMKIIRTMPNTPALVGAGMTAISPNDQVSKRELQTILDLFNACGRAVVVEEKDIDAISAISGSSPAFAFMFIEALADGGVLMGLKREDAYIFAAQAVLGAAKLVLETDKHPGELKDVVSSPGGTTIEGIKTLEAKGLRSALITAVEETTKKAKLLG